MIGLRFILKGALVLALSCARNDNNGVSQIDTGPGIEAATPVEGAVSDTVLYPDKPWTDEWLESEAERYLSNATLRRQVLEASLTSHKNIYARTRLSGYGVQGEGWELLPTWIPKTREIDDQLVQSMRAGQALSLDSKAKPLWDGVTPTKMADWVALGRRVFYQYPLRSEIFADHALRSPKVAERVGLRADRDGSWPGVVAFQSVEGEAEIGITCALCHVSIEEGRIVEGRARRDFDYGEMRLSFYRDTGSPISDDLVRRMSSWGPGRADITQDNDEDPVAIVDLWGVRDHSYLTQSGTIRNMHPIALAIRQETQILHANHELIRPPRELAWALAMYVYSLSPPPPAAQKHNPQLLERGEQLFAKGCEHCHIDKNHGGLPIPVSKVGTDKLLAMGGARGTGLYRPAPLTRVVQAGPYLHDGSVATLAELLDSERKVPGHRFGSDWSKGDKQALLAFLSTL